MSLKLNRKTVRDAAASLVLLGFVAVWFAMLWIGRDLGTLLELVGVAVVLGAGYHLWDTAMEDGANTATELQGGSDGDDEETE